MKRAYLAKSRIWSVFKCTTIVSLGLSLATTPVLAQEDEDEGELEAIVITGSNIPTVELEGPSPLVLIDREEIDQSSSETLGDLLRRIPQNNTGSFDEKFQNSFAPGSSGVSLRGLGMQNTLLLMDGRRVVSHAMPQNTTTVFGDLNSVPMAAVERIEVLLDGASAIYGSDAVAGVINIITRKDFDGVEINASYADTDDKNVGWQRYDITAGTTSDRGNALITMDYYQNNAMFYDDRDYSASADQSTAGGWDFRSSSGNPGSIKILPGSEQYEGGFYKVPADSSGSPTAEEILTNPGINRFDYAPWMSSYPKREDYGASGIVNYRVNDWAELFMQTYYRKRSVKQWMAPTPAFGDIRDFDGDGDGQTLVPADNPFNPFGEAVSFRHRLTEGGPRLSDIDYDVYRFLPGVRFDIGDNWQAETAFMHMESKALDYGRNYISAEGFTQALQSTDPETAFNVFGSGAGINNEAVLEGMKVNTFRSADSKLRMWDVKAGGDIYELPGGTVGLAVGAEVRREEMVDTADSLSMQSKIIGSGGTSNSGSRDAEAEYLEFYVPIFGEGNALPGLNSLAAQVAWRFEQYSDFGNTDNPKVGLKWSPIEHLLVRTTYQTSFRAPMLPELYMGETYSYPSLMDPHRGDTGMQYRVRSGGNEDLDPEETDSWTAGVLFDVPLPNDMTLDFSVNWSNFEQEGLITSVGSQYILMNEDRFPGKVTRRPQNDEDKSSALPGPDLVLGTEDDLPNDGVGIPGNVELIDDSLFNLAEMKVESVDIGARFGLPTSIGNFAFDTTVVNMYKMDYQARPGEGFVDQMGSFTTPEILIRSGVWWGYDKYSVGLELFHTDSYDQVYGSDYGLAENEIDSHTTLDLQASYSITDYARLTVGARNVTDEDPPWVDNDHEGYALSAPNHSPFGTVLYARLRLSL